jgi:hypothetical protein
VGLDQALVVKAAAVSAITPSSEVIVHSSNRCTTVLIPKKKEKE